MKGDIHFKSKPKIADDILNYLKEHPQAADTLEGIVEWWLLERKIINQAVIVKEAIGKLIKEGLVIEYFGKDSKIHYRINHENSR